MTRYEEAIAAEEADRAFERLRAFHHVVLAVSGGPDSLALLTLVAEWRARAGNGAPVVAVATVDHGLRERSRLEAQAVAEISAGLGLPHTILEWTGEKPKASISDAARDARYALLDGYAQNISCGASAAVVTAHHQDDQAETFVMRLMRGGGVTALAAIPDERRLAGGSSVMLIRPLLQFSKQRLVATLAVREMSWFDDPTNGDTDYERVRVRQALAATELGSPALAIAARRMRDAADGLQFATGGLAQSAALVLDRNIYARFERVAFEDAPTILRQMLLEHLIGCFGGTTRRPELSELERLAQRFTQRAPFTVTLGGAVISAGSRYVRLWREPARIDATPLALTSGKPMLWDERFIVAYDGGGAEIAVRPLGGSAADLPDDVIRDGQDIPRAAIASLPAFYDSGALAGVPILAGPGGCQMLADGRQLKTQPIPLLAIGRPLCGQ